MAKTKGNIIDKYKNVAIVSWAILGVIALLACLFFLLGKIQSVFTLFILTMAVVYILRPLVDWLEAKKIPRVLAVVITYLLVILLIFLLLLYFIPLVADQVRGFALNLPRYFKAVVRLFKEYQGRFRRLHVPPEANRLLEQWLVDIKKAAVKVASGIPSFTVNVVSSLFYLVLAPVIAFYILKDLKVIRETVINIIPPKHRKEALVLISKVSAVVSGFLRGQFLVALSVAVLSTIVLWALGVDYPLLLGTITGVLNIIPYFGPIFGGAIAALVALFKSPILALWVIIAMFAIQQLDGMFISPFIMGGQVDLHPAVVIFSLLIGGALFGFLGLFLAIPVAAATKAIFLHFSEKQAAGI